MKFYTLFVLIFLTLSACAEITDDKENIYMAGIYWEGNLRKACYWVNGLQKKLDTPIGAGSDSMARAIAVKNGKVYTAGIFSVRNPPLTYNACFWVNRERKDLAVPEGVAYSVARDIAVSETKVYVAGYYYSDDNYTRRSDSTVACYWINGERIDMPEIGSEAYAIAVRNDKVYMTGVYSVYKDGYVVHKPCLWINGEKTDLDTPSGSNDYVFDICLSDDKTYIVGIINQTPQSCYWVDGVRTDLSIADNYYIISAPAIAVSKGKVYTAGAYYSNSGKDKGYYSVDETIIPLNVPDETNDIDVNDLTIIAGKVYTVGHYYVGAWATCGAGFHGFHTACYWIDGIKTDLSPEMEIYAITTADRD
jgi:hypothetical protein